MFDITDKTEAAIYAVWDAVAADAYEICEGDNEIAIELVLDAGRLTMEGYADADAEISKLNAELGFAEVRAALAKRIQLL